MIAITGANGLLGSCLVRKLIQQNETFIAIKRKGSDTSLINDIAEKITWRDADITDTESLSEALKDVTHVIHTAAIVSFNPTRADEVMEINVQGTRNVVNICLANNVKRLVHVSSVAALGRQKGQEVITESNKWVESPFNSVYATSKYMAELEVFRGQEEGMSTVIINPSLILAGANWNQSSAQLFKYVWGQKPFYIDGVLNYVDVADLTELIYTLLYADVQGERFIASAGKISYKDFFEKIAHGFNKRPPTIKLGKSFLKIGSFVERFRTWIAGGEPAITRETARLAGSDFLFENKKVKNKLNFEFQPIDRTLQRCCEYYLAKMIAKK